MHTKWSDGEGTINDMANAALERNYQYIAITDHTQGLKIAGGLDEQRLAKQAKEISDLNRGFKKQGFTILKSAVVNLSPQGESLEFGLCLDKSAVKRSKKHVFVWTIF